MADQWYYSHEGVRLGPCSARQLKELAASGGLLRTDTVWKQGTPHGVPADRVKNLFAVAQVDAPGSKGVAVSRFPAPPSARASEGIPAPHDALTDWAGLP